MDKKYFLGSSTPTETVKQLRVVKNALVENGLVSLTTPNEMLPDAIEKGLENLKPENVRGNVKIGNVVGNIIETLDDVSVENPEEKYQLNGLANAPVYSIMYSGLYPYVYCRTSTGVGSTVTCYNTITNSFIEFSDTRANSYRDYYYINGYNLYKGGDSNSSSDTISLYYFYKDEIGINTEIRACETYLAAYVGNKTYIITDGSSYRKTLGALYCFEGSDYTKILGTVNNAFFKMIGLINDTLYISCKSTDATEGGIYKVQGTTATKIYEQVSLDLNSEYSLVLDDTIFTNGTSGLFMIKNDIVTKLDTNNFYLKYAKKTKNGTIYLSSSSSSYKNFYCIPKGSTTAIMLSEGYGEINIIEHGEIEYVKVLSSKNVLKYENSELNTFYSFANNGTMYGFCSTTGVVYLACASVSLSITNDIDINVYSTTTVLSNFFEDENGDVFAGQSAWLKLTPTTYEMIWQGTGKKFTDIFKVDGNRFILYGQGVAVFKNGTFQSLHSTSYNVVYFEYKEDKILYQLDSTNSIYIIEEKDDIYRTFIVK